MISFMNFMNKKSPFEEEEEQDQKTKSKEPVHFMSWQDAVFLLVIIALVVGGYYYFQYTKQQGAKQFAECNALYEANDFIACETCYGKTWDLSYVSDTMELVRQERLGLIADMRTLQMDVFQSVESYLLNGDTSSALEEMNKMTKPLLLLNQSQLDLWTEWSRIQSLRAAISAAIPTAPVADTTQKQEIPKN